MAWDVSTIKRFLVHTFSCGRAFQNSYKRDWFQTFQEDGKEGDLVKLGDHNTQQVKGGGVLPVLTHYGEIKKVQDVLFVPAL